MSKWLRGSMLGADFPFLSYFGMLLVVSGLAMLSTERGWVVANHVSVFLGAK